MRVGMKCFYYSVAVVESSQKGIRNVASCLRHYLTTRLPPSFSLQTTTALYKSSSPNLIPTIPHPCSVCEPQTYPRSLISPTRLASVRRSRSTRMATRTSPVWSSGSSPDVTSPPWRPCWTSCLCAWTCRGARGSSSPWTVSGSSLWTSWTTVVPTSSLPTRVSR